MLSIPKKEANLFVKSEVSKKYPWLISALIENHKFPYLPKNDFKKLSLLDALEECLSVDVYIGIGYGKTANGSKQKAFEGISLAQNYGGNTAFVIFENGEQIGPLFHSSTSVTTENYDERFN